MKKNNIEKILNLRDKEDKKIYHGFYHIHGQVFFLREEEPGIFYMSTQYSHTEHKIVVSNMTKDLERIGNPSGYLNNLSDKAEDLTKTVNWMKKILGAIYEPREPKK